MIRIDPPITEKALRDARTGALLAPRRRITRAIYISVGHLPTSKAADLFERVVNAYKNNLDSFNYENVFIAIREGENRIEVFNQPIYKAPAVRWWPGWKLRWPRAR